MATPPVRKTRTVSVSPDESPKAEQPGAQPQATPTPRAWLADLLPLALLFLAAVLFFLPLWQGKTLTQSDIVQVGAMSKELSDYRQKFGEEPYWAMRQFSGMPATTFGVQYEGNGLGWIYRQRLLWLGPSYVIGHLAIGMMLMFGLLRAHQVQPWLAAAGGLAFGFFTYHADIVGAGHSNKFMALMMVPGVLWGLTLTFTRRWLLGLALFTCWLGFHLYYNHVQMTYYVLFPAVGYALVRLGSSVLGGRWGLPPDTEGLSPRGGLLRAAGLALCALIALGPNAVPLYPLYQFSKYTNRGGTDRVQVEADQKTGGLPKDKAFEWSQARPELLTLLAPRAVSEGTSASFSDQKNLELMKQLRRNPNVPKNQLEDIAGYFYYWGGQPFTGAPFYAGVIVVALAVVALSLVSGPLPWLLLYVVLIALLQALGAYAPSVGAAAALLSLPPLVYWLRRRVPQSQFKLAAPVVGVVIAAIILMADDGGYRISDLFFDNLPMMSKFRVPSSWLILLGVCLPWLAMLGAQHLLKTELTRSHKMRALLVAGATVGGVLLMLVALPELFLSFTDIYPGAAEEKLKNLGPQNLELLQQDRISLLRGDALRSLGLLALTGLLCVLALDPRRLAPQYLGLGVFLLVGVDLWLVNKRTLPAERYLNAKQVQQNYTPRPADVVLQRDSSYFRIFPVTRRDAFTAAFHHNIVGYSPAPLGRYTELRDRYLSGQPLVPQVLNMLNTKYILLPQDYSQYGLPLLLKTDDGEHIHLNPGNLGPVWLAPEVRVMPTPDQALDTLRGIDTRKVAVVEARDASAVTTLTPAPLDSTETAQIVTWQNRKMVYRLTTRQPRLAVFSEVFYPNGWTATLNGQPAPILQTNYVLRGLVVPAGTHEVIFAYNPTDVAWAQNVAATMSVLWFGVVLGGLGWEGFSWWRRRKKA